MFGINIQIHGSNIAKGFIQSYRSLTVYGLASLSDTVLLLCNLDVHCFIWQIHQN